MRLDWDEVDLLREKGWWCPNLGVQELAIAISKNPKYREVLFGGARGGGKTDVSIAILAERFEDRRSRQLVIRRNADDLKDFESRAFENYHGMGVKLRRNPMVLRSEKGGAIYGGHLKDEEAYTKYQGHEYNRINIEELTQIPTESAYKKLISSCRSKYPDLFAQVFATTNPGGVGSSWVKKRFVKPDRDICDVFEREYRWKNRQGKEVVSKWYEIYDKESDMWRAYIPATIDDNPILIENDPVYVKQLEDLKSTDYETYKAWRFGDWDIYVGQVFGEFKEHLHVYNRFSDWGIRQEEFNQGFKICGMDWGFRDECVLLWAYFDNITEREERAFIYREIHDNHKNPDWWAEVIRKQLERERVDVLALPHDTFNHLGGEKPIADKIKLELEKLPVENRPRIVMSDKLTRDLKKAAIYSLHGLFGEASDGRPFIQIRSSCEYLIETLPGIIYKKEGGGEEIDGNCEDHALDALFYTLMTASRERGRVLNKGELVKSNNKRGIYVGKDTYEDLGMDISSLIKNGQKKGGDWKTL